MEPAESSPIPVIAFPYYSGFQPIMQPGPVPAQFGYLNGNPMLQSQFYGSFPGVIMIPTGLYGAQPQFIPQTQFIQPLYSPAPPPVLYYRATNYQPANPQQIGANEPILLQSPPELISDVNRKPSEQLLQSSDKPQTGDDLVQDPIIGMKQNGEPSPSSKFISKENQETKLGQEENSFEQKHSMKRVQNCKHQDLQRFGLVSDCTCSDNELFQKNSQNRKKKYIEEEKKSSPQTEDPFFQSKSVTLSNQNNRTSQFHQRGQSFKTTVEEQYLQRIQKDDAPPASLQEAQTCVGDQRGKGDTRQKALDWNQQKIAFPEADLRVQEFSVNQSLNPSNIPDYQLTELEEHSSSSSQGRTPQLEQKMKILKQKKMKNERYSKTIEQLAVLEKEYQQDPKWNRSKIVYLANLVGMSPSQVYKWNWDRKLVLPTPEEQFLALGKKILNSDLVVEKADKDKDFEAALLNRGGPKLYLFRTEKDSQRKK